jgi:hypothetical protein
MHPVGQLLSCIVSKIPYLSYTKLKHAKSLSGNIGVLLLCEVAAKPFHELVDSDYNADQNCKDNKKLYAHLNVLRYTARPS